MPDPDCDAQAWSYIMYNFRDEWSCIVHKYVYFESPSDRSKVKERKLALLANAEVHLRCALCGDQSELFATQRGLDAHMRRVHKWRTTLSQYIDDSGICPVCHVNFHNRVRVLKHVCEKRCRAKVKYQTCHQRLTNGEFPVVDADVLTSAFAQDKRLRAEAKKRGRSQVIATLPAKRARRSKPATDTDGPSQAEDPSHTAQPGDLGATLTAGWKPLYRINGKRPAHEASLTTNLANQRSRRS